MPQLAITYRALQAQEQADQRRQQQDYERGQRFFDTEAGKIALCKALTHHARHCAPLEIMKERERNHTHWPLVMANKSLWITPEEFCAWNTAKNIPSRKHIFATISTARTKNGSRKFYWEYIAGSFYDQDHQIPKWQYCTSDMDIAPNTAMAEYHQLWNEWTDSKNKSDIRWVDQDCDEWQEDLAHEQQWPQAPRSAGANSSNKIA